MRIPLDYYRILGLPIQATSEQLRQAHRDRTLQLPRREYSDAAISARKQLLDQAYEVLSAPTLRKSYDASFLAKTYEIASDEPLDGLDHAVAATEDASLVDPHTPSVEIDEDQFIGALLVLQELGEYELVLKLGRPFLTGGSASLHDRRYGDPAIVFSDIVLTVALACLELGREQWQQGQYENAAEALETGQQLLLREGLFVNIRGEIQSDLYRLRPYRILELLAAPEEYAEARQTGLKLLQEMLRDRNGIDGTADDHSGLNIDDFLKFIQQLRGYLTAEEQRALFCQEANRPSAVATYLAVYALLAQGFAERYPELIHQANQYLAPLVNRQDVYLERAICALLLGQTEEASKALSLSQERDSISFIQQHSYDSPDLLPGLCLYTEQWFHDEVFPHFRDLANCRLSLKDYFADRHVQNYLESLPEETPQPVEQPVYATPPQPEARRSPLRTSTGATTTVPVATQTIEELEPSVVAARPAYDNPEKSPEHEALIATARARIASRSSTATLDAEEHFPASISTAERDIHPSTEADDMRSHTVSPQRGQAEPPPPTKRRPPRRDADRPHPGRSATPKWLIPLALLLSILLFGALGAWLFRAWLSNQSATTADEKPLVQLDQPLLELPAEATDPTAAEFVDQDSAKRLIEQWLAAKSKAMGSTYDTAELNKILAEPKLAEWQATSEAAKQEGWYRTYKHDVKVESVELLANGQVVAAPGANGAPASTEGRPNPAIAPSATETGAPTASPSPAPEGVAAGDASTASTTPPATTTPDQATIIANVKETTEIYQDGNAAGASQTEDLRIQYNLVRKEGKWLIQGWQLL